MANSKKALDENGVLYLWGKVKTYVATAIANIKLPSKTSDLTNDSGFITAKDVPEGAAASSTARRTSAGPLGMPRARRGPGRRRLTSGSARSEDMYL